jgi:uncharacterized membrane protein YfhO
MTFSQQKLSTLKKEKEKGLSTFLIALVTAACLFVPYMIMSEGYFTFYGDFNVQQIPFYQECHRALKSGDILWNWNTDLGVNTVASYSFYLWGSPFFWLTLPFPNSFVPYLMGPLLILKFACAALAAYLYLRRFTRTPDAAQIGGLLYAFSGFSVYNIFFNHFHEAIIYFPLLLLSLELFITENKRFIFAIMVFLCAIANYFFFFGMVIFTVIYFFVRLFSGAIKLKVSRFFALAFEAVLGLCLAACILLPSLMALTDNPRISNTLIGWNAIMYGKEQIYANILQCFFFPPDIPARPVFFPGAEVKWSSLGGWLPLFSMVGVFTFFSSRKNHWLRRVIGISIFMALVPILNSVFYAFNTAYYARWYYMPILLMCLMTVTMFEDSKANWSFGYKWVLGITLAVSLVIGFFPQRNDEGKIIYGLYTQAKDLTYIVRFWISCLIAVASLVILGQLIKILKEKPKAFYKISTACVCIISIIYGNVFIATGRAHSYDVKEIVIDSLIEGEVYLEDNKNFRIDTFDCVDNTSMFLGYSGINAFHSVVPASITKFYDYIGIERSVASRPESDYYAIRGLLSVKYLLNRKSGESFVDTETDETAMPGYKYLKTESGYYVYENENYIPYGFSYDYYMDYDFCNQFQNQNRANMMLKAILLTDEQIEKYGHLMKDISEPEEDSTKALIFGDEYYVEDCEDLAKTSAYHFETDNHGFTAKVSREKETLVFFSVPFDKGWSATVNGQKAEIEQVNVGFMAVKVPAGESAIRFNYQPPALKLGLLITIGSCILFIIYIFAFLLFSRKHNSKNVYPEGDIMLHEWLAEETADDLPLIPKKQNKSILDDDPQINIPDVNSGFEGGFKINNDILKDDNK